MNRAYFIFDSNIQNSRKVCVENIKKEMSQLPFLNSETIMISSREELAKSLSDFKPLKFASDVRLGAAGLLLGTIKLYEKAVANNVDQLIVFEDDFIIGSDFYKNLLSILEERKEFDIISLYAHSNSLEDIEPLKNDNLSSLTIKYNKYNIVPKLFSYVISTQGMKKFLDYAYSSTLDPVDMVLLSTPPFRIDSYVINPTVISMGSIDNVLNSGHAIEELSNISRTEYVRLEDWYKKENLTMIDKSLIVESQTKNGYIAYYKNDLAFVNHLQQENAIFETGIVMNHLANIVKASKVIIDGGAHAGSHTTLYKSINPNVVVHAFEPQLKMFELLSHNVKQNNFNNVFLYNLALANKALATRMGTSVSDVYYDENHEYMRLENGELYESVYTNVSYGDDNIFNLGGLGFGEDGEEVSTITIDSLRLNQCNFIKLDLEGAEPLALSGAMETIKKFHPTILFEHNHHQLSDEMYKHFGASKKTSFEILSELGYIITPIGDDNYLAKYVK
jgi:FkbM family methyltransferase